MKSSWKSLLLLALCVWVALVCVIFAFDHGDQPIKGDAVVVLQGSKTRLPEGLKLIRDGYAPLLVISYGDRKQTEKKLCAPGQTVVKARVICFDPHPTSTRGEAEFIGRLAKSEKLSRINVVTSQFHIARARFLIERCYDGKLQMVGSSQEAWKFPWYALSESVKAAYQLVFARHC